MRMSTVRLLLVVRLVMLLGRRHPMLVIVGLGVSGGVLSSVMGLLFGIPVLQHTRGIGWGCTSGMINRKSRSDVFPWYGHGRP